MCPEDEGQHPTSLRLRNVLLAGSERHQLPIHQSPPTSSVRQLCRLDLEHLHQVRASLARKMHAVAALHAWHLCLFIILLLEPYEG